MAKKKNQTKKHKFKHAEPIENANADATTLDHVHETTAPRLSRPVAGERDFSYVGRDLRRIGILAAALVALEVVLAIYLGKSGWGF